jgi:DegV family protein with EDD domain
VPTVAVVSDTTAYLPGELVDRIGITLVPLYVNFGSERTEREPDITDYPAFFDELRGAENLPTTSQPSVGDFASAYEPLLAQGRDVVSIHLSAKLSGTADSARQAAQQLEREGKGGERVRVIDSESGAGGLGMLLLVCAAAAKAGLDLDAVQARVDEARADMKIWFALDTLEFLKRGGRIGPASAWIGSTLRVKPILSMESGELKPVERVRTSSRAFERLVDYARQRHESGADGWVVQHISAPDQAAQLTDRCREVFGCDPLFIGEIGPVFAAHIGPGLLGVGSIPSRYLE